MQAKRAVNGIADAPVVSEHRTARARWTIGTRRRVEMDSNGCKLCDVRLFRDGDS